MAAIQFYPPDPGGTIPNAYIQCHIRRCAKIALRRLQGGRGETRS